MKEIEVNKKAWSLIAKDHYEYFKKVLLDDSYQLTKIVVEELGNIKGKKVIHLQCNTGADSIKLAQMGAIVTGVDLVPENIHYAKKLAQDLKISNIDFIEADIMELSEIHEEKYDIVFTSEGAIGWLPDLDKWGKTIEKLLNKDGFFYVYDLHPFYLMMDEEKFMQNILQIKYPYFSKKPDLESVIGGYATVAKEAENYFWMYKVSDIINALTKNNLHVDFLNEFDEYITGSYGLEQAEEYKKEEFFLEFFKGNFPMSFSLKACVCTN